MRYYLEHPFWEWLTIGSVIVGFIACIVFLVRYLHEAGRDAWRNPFGRYLIQRKALLAVLFGVVLANRTFGSWAARDVVTALLMLAFALQTFVPYRLLVDAQKAHSEEEAPSHDR